ncbi:MAG TPA: UDP-N-acetylmuramoyl-L-alanyl-D-glutamate--2,6-diaminopimelate ligase [Phycisphaerae bacterium]|nr:UDP-N-acetylmuramoyl-L-alanyl-D-glutamate--2,6-diaminopimelate ligase [Phycisphaerae bacterium]
MHLSELLYSIPVFTQIVRGRGDVPLTGVAEDSRQVRPGDLFIARAGTRTDGIRFIQDAVSRGASAVMVENPDGLEIQSDAALVVCSKPAAALGWLAQAMQGFPTKSMDLFAITGTNGKTTTTYLMRSICRAADIPCGLITTIQIDDGREVAENSMTTPDPILLAGLFLRMKNNGVRVVAMEASSHALAQDRLAGLDFKVAMFSNLTQDHLDYHGTLENYAAAKGRLFESLQPCAFAVINADDPWAARMVQNTKARVISYGLKQGADVVCRINLLDQTGMSLELTIPDAGKICLKTPLVGRHNAQNIACAFSAAWCAGFKLDRIVAGIEQMSCVPGRLQPVTPPGMSRSELPFQVLVDYAHTHDALENVLRSIRPWTTGKIICVFGCGGDRDKTKRPKMAAAAEKLADSIIVTSDNPRTENPDDIITMILGGFSGSIGQRLVVQPDRALAIRAAVEKAVAGDVILIAGKGHENYQIIGSHKHHFDDVEQASEALTQRFSTRV